MKKIVKKGKQAIAFLLCFSMLIGGIVFLTDGTNEVQAEETTAETTSKAPTYLAGSDWTRIGFEDFYKNADSNEQLASSGTDAFKAASSYGTAADNRVTATYMLDGEAASSLDNTYFEGRVQSKGGAVFNYGGLQFQVDGDKLVLDASAIRTLPEEECTYEFEADGDYRISTFSDTRFTLRISMKYHVDSDDDNNLDDLQVSVWVNDVICGGDYLYITDVDWDEVTPTISIYNADETYATTEYWSVKAVSDRPEDSYTRITFEDFTVTDIWAQRANDPNEFKIGTHTPEGLAKGAALLDGKYGLYARSTSHDTQYVTAKYGSIANSYVEGFVEFGSLVKGTANANYSRLEVGGFKLGLFSDGGYLYNCTLGTGNADKKKIETSPSSLGLSSLADTVLKLGISYTVVEDTADSKSDLQCKLWINDEYVYTYTIEDGGAASDATSGMLYIKDNARTTATDNRYIIIGSHRNEQEAMLKEQSKLKGYTHITLADFGIGDGIYKKTNDVTSDTPVVYGYYGETDGTNLCVLDKTYFETDIIIDAGTSMSFRYAHSDFRFYVNGTDLYIRNYQGGNANRISNTSVGFTTFRDTRFRLGIKTDYSTQQSGETGAITSADIEFEIYINDQFVKTLSYSSITSFPAYCGVYVGSATSESDSIAIQSVYEPGDEPEMLTFADFGIADGTYDYDQGQKEVGQHSSRNTWDKTIFEGKITKGQGDIYIDFGTVQLFMNAGNFRLCLYHAQNQTTEIYKNPTYKSTSDLNVWMFTEYSDTDNDYVEDTVTIILNINDRKLAHVIVQDRTVHIKVNTDNPRQTLPGDVKNYVIDNMRSTLTLRPRTDSTIFDVTSVGYTDAPLKDLGDITDLNDTSLKKQVNDKDAEILRDVLLETKTLTEYQKSRANTNQVEPDEVIDIKDLIGLKKLMLAE